MRILAIPGSVRSDSHNARLLRYVAEQAPAGVEVEIWPDLKSIPPYDQDDDVEPAPASVADLRRAIAAADALLIATPEYNHSIPGVLKNAIDWASRPRASTPLQNLPAAVIGASTGRFGAVWAQAELRKVLAATGARVIDLELAVPLAAEAFDAQGRPTEPEQRARVGELVGALIAAAQARAYPAEVPALAA
ncbi:MAG TPA: NAD(P)H-dependent oxidoreductase [Solirubrobacterales bacterium]|nr:NAD(P)H-dependent oxidoreductase [Solirubrobacterales bacterium]